MSRNNPNKKIRILSESDQSVLARAIVNLQEAVSNIKIDSLDEGEVMKIAKVASTLVPKTNMPDKKVIVDEIIRNIPIPKEGRSPLFTGDTPPISPKKGDLWYKD